MEAGEVIDSETAEVLNALGMEPLEVGLDLKLVYEDGEVFDRGVLEIDTEEYREQVETATGHAFNLAVNAGYLTERTAPSVVATAAGNGRAVAVEAGVLAEEVVEDIVRKAAGEASAVDAELDLESVDTGEGEKESEREEEEDSEETVEEEKEDEEVDEETGEGDSGEAEDDEDNDAEETEDNDGKEVN
ncbi:MAG: hypothetical protein SVS85_02550 [Candidatus Nanohaloarchaea archaeon]|nr:hypothetical protein [Candidatus Nanohaloarchaea archaeon]